MNPLQVAEERLLHILAKSYGKDLDKEDGLKKLLLAVYAAGKVSGSVLGQR